VATDRSESVRVVGLRDFQGALKELDLARDLRVVNKEAAELVAGAARTAFSSRSDVAHEVADSVRAMAQQRSASVSLGETTGAAASALGAEFGSVRFTQFQPWTGNGGSAGISLYPTIRSHADEIVELYAKALDELAKKSFPD